MSDDLVKAAEILWCCHVRGPDDIYAAPDYETALQWADYLNSLNWHRSKPQSYDDCLVKATPALWPYDKARHREQVVHSMRGFATPTAARVALKDTEA